VVLCDSNVWLALTLSKHAHHHAARDWLERVEEPEAVCFCRATQQTFLRLLTNASVLRPYGNEPLTNRQAWNVFESLLADDRIALRAEEPPGLEGPWRRFALRNTASPKIWMDAYLAAFAIAGGYRMVTTDGGFRQFKSWDVELIGQRTKE
jgi:toxin-antitoxin system PIN domain toxin